MSRARHTPCAAADTTAISGSDEAARSSISTRDDGSPSASGRASLGLAASRIRAPEARARGEPLVRVGTPDREGRVRLPSPPRHCHPQVCGRPGAADQGSAAARRPRARRADARGVADPSRARPLIARWRARLAGGTDDEVADRWLELARRRARVLRRQRRPVRDASRCRRRVGRRRRRGGRRASHPTEATFARCGRFKPGPVARGTPTEQGRGPACLLVHRAGVSGYRPGLERAPGEPAARSLVGRPALASTPQPASSCGVPAIPC